MYLVKGRKLFRLFSYDKEQNTPVAPFTNMV